MLGTNETKVTYPTFISAPDDSLYFTFRDDNAGNGDLYMYQYDAALTTWSAVAGTVAGKVIDGKGSTRSPYALDPVFDDNFGNGGYFHLFWCWSQAALNTRYDVAYARWDGTNWTQVTGAAQTIPITPANDDVADPIVAGTYLIVVGAAVDSCGYPHAVYGWKGADNFHNVYHLWYNGASWVKLQITTTANDPTDPFENVLPTIVIDKDSDTVYILLEDGVDADGITMYTSDPGDFTVWTKSRIYKEDVGYTMVLFDPYQWREHKRLHMAIFPWPDGAAAYPVILLEYTPSGFALFDADNFPDLHTNDTDTPTGIHHTLGAWEPLANGNGAAPALVFLDGDVIMVVS